MKTKIQDARRKNKVKVKVKVKDESNDKEHTAKKQSIWMETPWDRRSDLQSQYPHELSDKEGGERD